MIKGINLEAEMDILSIVLNNEHVLLENSDKWSSNLFSDPFHVKLVDTVKKNVIEGLPIEISTLSSNANEQNAIRSLKLRDKAPEFFDNFYKILEECLIHRELDKLKDEIKNKLGQDDDRVVPSELLHKIKIDLEDLEQLRTTSVYTPEDFMDSVLGRYLEIYDLAQQGIEYCPDSVVQTPFDGLNKILKRGGFLGGDLVIVAASPSTGKSEFALNLASHASIENEKNVFVYSLEMRKESLLERILLAESKVESFKLERGKLTTKDLEDLKIAAEVIKGCPMMFEDNLSGDVFDIITSIRKIHAKTPLKMVVIDYIQLVKYPLKVGSRNDEVAAISRLFKQEALRLDIPFIVLSQISRKPLHENREPDLSDLRDSGAIEQDADTVIFLHATAKERKRDFIWKTKALIRKQREGSTGDIFLENYKNIQTFKEINETQYKNSFDGDIDNDSIPF
jgi:replicative DNA helicase